MRNQECAQDSPRNEHETCADEEWTLRTQTPEVSGRTEEYPKSLLGILRERATSLFVLVSRLVFQIMMENVDVTVTKCAGGAGSRLSF